MFRLSAASRIAPGPTIGAAPTLAPMIDAPAMKAAAAAMVTASLRMMTSQCLIKLYNMSELPSGIDVNQAMSGTGHLGNCRRYRSHRGDSERPHEILGAARTASSEDIW